MFATTWPIFARRRTSLTEPEQPYVAFIGNTIAGRGSIVELASLCKAKLDAGEKNRIAIFDNKTGRPVDVDFRGTPEQMLNTLARRHATSESPAASEPAKARAITGEVSLLPRHWDWLRQGRGGTSATLRRLIDSERKRDAGERAIQQAVETTHRFIWDMAGDEADFEAATRALFAHDFARFESLIQAWPADICTQTLHYLHAAR